MSASTIKCRFNHVAVAVDDLDAAVKWYTEVLGFHQIIPAAHMNRNQDPYGIVFRGKGFTFPACLCRKQKTDDLTICR